MRMNVYSIFDTASGTYMRPFYTQADGEAVRMFNDLVTDPEHAVGKHPEDYSIWRLGTFDDNKGDLKDEVNECLQMGINAKSEGQ